MNNPLIRKTSPAALLDLRVVRDSAADARQAQIENYHVRLENFDAEYVSIGGYFGVYEPEVFAAAPKMLAALRGLRSIMDRAESNASGNPEWDRVSKAVKAARDAIADAEGIPA